MESRGNFILGCFLTKIIELTSNPFQLLCALTECGIQFLAGWPFKSNQPWLHRLLPESTEAQFTCSLYHKQANNILLTTLLNTKQKTLHYRFELRFFSWLTSIALASEVGTTSLCIIRQSWHDYPAAFTAYCQTSIQYVSRHEVLQLYKC